MCVCRRWREYAESVYAYMSVEGERARKSDTEDFEYEFFPPLNRNETMEHNFIASQ